MIVVPISIGELVDKVTILELKLERIDDPQRLAHVREELNLLRGIMGRAMLDTGSASGFVDELRKINAAIWNAEEAIRACETVFDFGPAFVELARTIYRENDRRAAVKRQINVTFGSALVEEKSY